MTPQPTVQVSVTQYAELATSTCTPLGGGSQQCNYQYINRISTTTSTTTGNYATSTFVNGTTSIVYKHDSLIEFTLILFIFMLVFYTFVYFGKMILRL